MSGLSDFLGTGDGTVMEGVSTGGGWTDEGSSIKIVYTH